MDFARKQLEKYGWSDGKGLGKNENGIAQALKPKLKRSVAGIGHDAAKDFTEHWWSELYNKASSNLEVHEKNGKTKRIVPKEEFEITNSMWKLKRKPKSKTEEAQYGDFFVKKAILTSGGAKTKKVNDVESEDEEMVETDPVKMTDEELFAACEGRTAHKGARHGLKASGKLARIEEQERLLLRESKYDGYSQRKKPASSVNDLQVVEDMNLNSDGDKDMKKKKKKKKKVRLSKADEPDISKEDIVLDSECVDMAEKEATIPKKKKKKRKAMEGDVTEYSDCQENSIHVEEAVKSKKALTKREDDNHESAVDKVVTKSKKKKYR